MGVQFITSGRLEIREPQRAANKAPPPRPWKQESFATHSGKKHTIGCTWMYWVRPLFALRCAKTIRNRALICSCRAFFCQFHQASLIHLAWTRFATRRFTWASGAQGLSLANPLDVSGYLWLCLQASHWHALTFPGASMAITFMHNAEAHCNGLSLDLVWFESSITGCTECQCPGGTYLYGTVMPLKSMDLSQPNHLKPGVQDRTRPKAKAA